MIVTNFIPQITTDTDDFELPKYSHNTVLKICRVFEVDTIDGFCSEPSIQDADTFRTMLHEHFPREDTTYTDIFPKLNQFRSKPSHNCDNQVTMNFGWAVGNCPSPSTCMNGETTYTCSFSIDFESDAIGLDVSFYQTTGIVSGYGISRPSSSDK